MNIFFTVLLACICNQLIARLVDRLHMRWQLRTIGVSAFAESVHNEIQILHYVDLREQTHELQDRWYKYIDGRLQSRKIVINERLYIDYDDWKAFLLHIGVI